MHLNRLIRYALCKCIKDTTDSVIHVCIVCKIIMHSVSVKMLFNETSRRESLLT